SRRRDGVHCGRSLRGDTCRSPLGPSIITSRASCSVSPTSATLRQRFSPYGAVPLATPRTHSAPSLVFPAPRPPSISQVVQGPPPLPRPAFSSCPSTPPL